MICRMAEHIKLARRLDLCNFNNKFLFDNYIKKQYDYFIILEGELY